MTHEQQEKAFKHFQSLIKESEKNATAEKTQRAPYVFKHKGVEIHLYDGKAGVKIMSESDYTKQNPGIIFMVYCPPLLKIFRY